jgi:FHS family L-fucose permease-like MFS transporter
VAILAVSFFNSIMFPTIFSLGEAELGTLSGSGSGLLNMAIFGGAILPFIQASLPTESVFITLSFCRPIFTLIDTRKWYVIADCRDSYALSARLGG